jgi:NADPH-dependent 2,4-dienoyl-CoA reductase/sulfur reductase-like enzyme/rhodanese-related sulfurtransferase
VVHVHMNRDWSETFAMSNQPKKPERIVIVGGVAAGASAAARARRCDAHAEITILEKGPVVSFANCGLPYHLGGEIEQRSKLLVATPELFWKRFRINIRTHHEVTHIDRDKCSVSGRTHQGTEFSLPYDRLILATGSEPICPEPFQVTAVNVFQLWTLEDMDRILSFMKTGEVKKATVVGAGFVGLEVVEQLVRRGIEVTLVERLPQVLGPLDAEMAKLVEQEVTRNGVTVAVKASVAKLSVRDSRAFEVQLEDGGSLQTDLVIVGAGVRPRIELAREAGLVIGATGGVTINTFCQTSDLRIYAAGDMVEYDHGVAGRKMRVPLAGPANRSGRVAGTHAVTSSTSPLGPVQGTSIVRVFELGAGCTGLNERTCKVMGLDYRTATISAGHHASYFPGSKNLTLKLVYQAGSGKLLGAQAVGEQGVDKRIDVCATVLHFGGTVHDLAQLDLAYAPPYGAAKDAIHMAAFVAQNDLQSTPSLAAFNACLEGLQVVDVRNADELAKLPLVGAIHIPVDDLADRWQELDPTLPTITVCHSGKRGHVAACRLQSLGFQSVRNLNGGMSIRRLSD